MDAPVRLERFRQQIIRDGVVDDVEEPYPTARVPDLGGDSLGRLLTGIGLKLRDVDDRDSELGRFSHWLFSFPRVDTDGGGVWPAPSATEKGS